MVRKRKTTVPPPPSECPLNECMRLLAGTWTGQVIWYLREGVIERLTRQTSPPTVWYALTPAGQKLCEALVNVVDIAQGLKRTQVGSLRY
jgi:DNA-binding HxlR family transcriptional regulator